MFTALECVAQAVKDRGVRGLCDLVPGSAYVVDVAADAGIAAPINGAVAANANVAAPIDAAVAANIGSIASNATAISQQDAIISQTIDGEANHAGTTPMHLRRDAVRGLYRFATELDAAFAPLVTDRTVWTLGRIVVEPNAPSIVPGSARRGVRPRPSGCNA